MSDHQLLKLIVSLTLSKSVLLLWIMYDTIKIRFGERS